LAWSVVVAVLGVGGVAFAQPGLIVDPWKVSRTRGVELSSWRAGEPFTKIAGINELIVDPWRGARPPVKSRRLAQEVTVKRDALGSLEIRDPWPSSSAVATSAPARGAQSWVQSREIVDPWATSGKRAAGRVGTPIVDPWRR
jgi:hypothetical protein